ncbi:MAG: molybdopterin oxidoreductase family protein [Actinobacteria bacterium]|nr:molybdopterin oxidoreductase family protein [Actinomycetota bacterium]
MRRALPVMAPGIGSFRKERSRARTKPRPREERLVETHCCYCGVQCGMYLRVSGDGKVFGVEPRDHDINKMKLCPKGVTAYQQVNHTDRLTTPLMRDRRDQPLRPVSWDAAFDRVVSEIQTIQAKYGADAFAVYSGSSLTTEKCYLMGKFARVALGTKHVDYNGRLCMVSAAGANKKAFGVDRAANPWSDMLETDVIMLLGANVGECFPVATQYFWGARDRGAKLITVDPRETPIARTADIHVPLRPGTDAAFCNAVLHVIEREGLVDEEFIAARTIGWGQLREKVREYPPERAGKICGVDPALIEQVALTWGRADKAMAFHARGIEHHTQGVNNCLTVINLVLATGQIGRPGKGYGTITGQGNGQGGREHGQKSDQLPGQRMIEDPEARAHICRAWGITDEELPHKGTSAVEMVHQAERGEIAGWLGICNNPLVSMPNTDRIARGYDSLEFHCQIDFFLSETCVRADVVLPSTCWAEDEGVSTNAEGRVIKYNKAAEPPGEAKPDWWIVCEIARRLGRHADKFGFGSAREIFEELRVASAGGLADYSGMTYERIEQSGGIFWPCPSEDHPGTPRLFEQSFAHPDGLARFHAIDWQHPAEEVDDEFPLRLTTGRTVAHYLSGNQTRRIDALVQQTPSPWIEVHPDLGYSNGDPVRIVSRRGSATYPALVVASIRRDTVFIPYHWATPVAANLMTVDALDPTSLIPEFKVCACRIEPGVAMDETMPPPVPPGGQSYDFSRMTDRQPSAPQGRGTGRG